MSHGDKNSENVTSFLLRSEAGGLMSDQDLADEVKRGGARIVEGYIAGLPWSPSATEHDKALVAGNLRTFWEWLHVNSRGRIMGGLPVSSTRLKCCNDGQPLRVDPCAACPENPHQEFRGWLDAYGHKTDYHREDMAACWYAGKRCAVSAIEASTEFTAWLDTYKQGVVFDHGDMAACWYASQRAATAEIVDAALKEAVLRTRKVRRDELAGQDRGIKGLCDQPITNGTSDDTGAKNG